MNSKSTSNDTSQPVGVSLKAQFDFMPDNEIVILVETNNEFEPLFKIGLNDLVLENFVFTRPRFVDQIKWLDA